MNARASIARTRSFFEDHRVGARTTALIGLTATVISTLSVVGVIRPCGEADAVALGLQNTREATTSEVSLAVAVKQPGGGIPPFSYTAEGLFDYQAGRARLVYDFSATADAEASGHVPAVIAGSFLYMKFPQVRRLAAKRPWLKVDMRHVDELLADLSAAAGGASSELDVAHQLEFTDPSRALDYLERTADVKEVGHQSVYGIQTSVHEGELRTPGGASYVVKAWIDDDDLIRRLTATGGPERAAYRIGFRHFGVKVAAEPPAAERVTAVADLLGG
ncbi:MAG: hypothetical protein QOE60_778 [Thermoleophilaceae bacterium]|nr:hypothetical protein [Thermoleophilaceae bacterium]